MRFAERPGSPVPGQRCPIVNRDAITAFGATGLSGVVPVLFMMAGGRLSIAACKRFVAPVKQPSRDHDWPPQFSPPQMRGCSAVLAAVCRCGCPGGSRFRDGGTRRTVVSFCDDTNGRGTPCWCSSGVDWDCVRVGKNSDAAPILLTFLLTFGQKTPFWSTYRGEPLLRINNLVSWLQR